ncbi:uncharacterized protein LOC127848858 [Dreissena polymorpha]|uniref:Uncharacterized protein n=1 Tax=Dreissena polymorpha TaxID=45954 RepID=A0A9D4IB99_DREPO|nr:uncharacterized protein LOC127848858 [Dreissena polymorpha]KAH3755245.1 hypothetical protein DPMN_189935 [Dreissena polymorpha]
MDVLHQCKSDLSSMIRQPGGISKADLSKNVPSDSGCQQVIVTVSGNGRVRLTTQSFIEPAINMVLSLEYTTTTDSNTTLVPLQILFPPGFRKDDIMISADGEIRSCIQETSSLSMSSCTSFHSENSTKLGYIDIDNLAKESSMIANRCKPCDENTDNESNNQRFSSYKHTQEAESLTDIYNPDSELVHNSLSESAHNRKGHNRNSSDYMSVSNRSKLTESCSSQTDCKGIADKYSQGFDECDGLISLEDNTVVKADINTNRVGMEHSLNDLNWQTPTPLENDRTSAPSNKTDTTKTLPCGQRKENTSIIVNMKQSIQRGFTKLLDELDVMDLCDHLYERAVVDFKFYSTMFELHFSRRNVRDISRYLLLHLSRIGVCKDRMIDALYGSAEYRFIPVFFPEEKI